MLVSRLRYKFSQREKNCLNLSLLRMVIVLLRFSRGIRANLFDLKVLYK